MDTPTVTMLKTMAKESIKLAQLTATLRTYAEAEDWLDRIHQIILDSTQHGYRAILSQDMAHYDFVKRLVSPTSRRIAFTELFEDAQYIETRTSTLVECYSQQMDTFNYDLYQKRSDISDFNELNLKLRTTLEIVLKMVRLYELDRATAE